MGLFNTRTFSIQLHRTAVNSALFKPSRPRYDKRISILAWRCSCSYPGIMITGFAPRISRNDLLRLTVFFLRVASLGAAVAYAVVVR